MVSVNVINKVLSVIDKLSLDKQSISDISEINQVEIENALNVLISHGYVLKSTSKSLHKGKKYKTNYYKASESAIEILNKLGIDINIRGETLSIEQFCEISNLLAKSL